DEPLRQRARSGAHRRPRRRHARRDTDAASFAAAPRASPGRAARVGGDVGATFARCVSARASLRLKAGFAWAGSRGPRTTSPASLAIVATPPVVAHYAIAVGTRIEPPVTAPASGDIAVVGELRTLGRAYARRRGRILEVRLVGAPEEIGHQHGRLLHDEMVAD